MKRLIQLFFIALFTITFSTANAANYRIDDKALDHMFATAQSFSLTESFEASVPFMADLNNSAFVGEKDPLVALLLDIFVGGLGIHRLYLGTETLTWVGYILTCGGIFGIVPLVDLIVLAVNYDDISPYIDNPRFFMW